VVVRLPYTLALMDENGVRRSLVDYLSGRANRPFGDVESVSGRTLQPFSFAGQRAAENLLAKARRALDDNDVDRASALVDRAIRLPFDEHEGAAPAALAVHMDLFCAVTDALERAEADDSRWLDAALDVLGGADGTAACDLRDVLVAIDHDYSLSPPEHARIRAAIASIPDRAELRDLDVTASELCEHVMSILDARRAYGRALEFGAMRGAVARLPAIVRGCA
jgi:hypothetical protein